MYAGNVQMAVVHEWISSIFPDVPPRLDDSTTEQRYFFRNTFTGATTICESRKNEVHYIHTYIHTYFNLTMYCMSSSLKLVIESENASTIAIVKVLWIHYTCTVRCVCMYVCMYVCGLGKRDSVGKLSPRGVGGILDDSRSICAHILSIGKLHTYIYIHTYIYTVHTESVIHKRIPCFNRAVIYIHIQIRT